MSSKWQKEAKEVLKRLREIKAERTIANKRNKAKRLEGEPAWHGNELKKEANQIKISLKIRKK